MLSFLFSEDCSAPCWNDGFRVFFVVVVSVIWRGFFVVVLMIWFGFAWNVWCFKLSVRWLCESYVMIVPFCNPWPTYCDKYCLFNLKRCQMCKINIFWSSSTDLTILSLLFFSCLLHLIAFAEQSALLEVNLPQHGHSYVFLLKFLC